MKPNKETYFTITASEFDALVEREFGHEFQLLADQEKYDCHLVANLDGKVDEWDEIGLLKFIQTGRYGWQFYAIANALVRQCVLPAGEYLIDCT